MVTEYDDKGKIFTQVISKERVLVTIKTIRDTIQGTIHVRVGARVKDEMNGEEKFFAVTNATIFNDQMEEVQRCEFMVLNIDQVVWLIPEETFS